MVKGTTRRLQKHQPKPSQRKIVTSSNTSTRLRKVVTFHDDVVTPASTSTQEEDVTLPDFGESETTPNQVDCPAGINIRTTARRYQNLVSRCFPSQNLLTSCVGCSITHLETISTGLSRQLPQTRWSWELHRSMCRVSIS